MVNVWLDFQKVRRIIGILKKTKGYEIKDTYKDYRLRVVDSTGAVVYRSNNIEDDAMILYAAQCVLQGKKPDILEMVDEW